jgi:hypothetical protein
LEINNTSFDLVSNGNQHTLRVRGAVFGVECAVTPQDLWDLGVWLTKEADKLFKEKENTNA